MEKFFDHKNLEQLIYKDWLSKGYFRTDKSSKKDNYCIVMPPPNITGVLHIGHAFQQTIMDTLIRYKRMQGKNVLFQVGTDHAGIATQIIVENRLLNKEGKSRLNFSREEFIKKIWEWQKKSRNKIFYQMRRLGYSIDWERESFTMDENFSKIVEQTFINLYRDNLIYRGKRIVNWDPKLSTAISDLEVENRNSNGFLWYIRYPLFGNVKTLKKLNYIVVATTRPETIFADTGIAVNPKDLRYFNLIGKFVSLPLTNRLIPIVGEESIDPNKGTGCVKITPAHDFKDYEIGKKHMLSMINIFTPDGKILKKAEIFSLSKKDNKEQLTEIPKEFHGLERFAARKLVLKECKRLGFLSKVQSSYDLSIPYSRRSDVIIEPMLKYQWYLRTDSLAKVALEAVKNNKIKFVPKSYENIYFRWMENIQDWCISRQLWWGHRIPAWYSKEGKIYVGKNELEIRKKYNLNKEIILNQDEDVMDTWFSSSLWIFSTLGWPEDTKTFFKFHPTDVLISGFDIIFFWIARVIMLTMYSVKDVNGIPQIPFKTVYLTGLILDQEGKKMSKSRGNIIDPIDVLDGISLNSLLKKQTENMMQPYLSKKIKIQIKKQFPKGIKSYGADALRFTLLSISSPGRDIHWNIKRLKGYSNFCNKLWNASRFILLNLEGQSFDFKEEKINLSLADRWILEKLNNTIKKFSDALDNYRFDLASSIIYEFIWHQFCDWYLEISKFSLRNGKEYELKGTRNTLIKVLDNLLRLAHPIIPFITEYIWKKISSVNKTYGSTIMLQSFPIFNPNNIYTDDSIYLEWIKKMVIAIRNIRQENNISLKKEIKIIFLKNCNKEVKKRINENIKLILFLTCSKEIKFIKNIDRDYFSSFVTKFVDSTEIIVPIKGLINKKISLFKIEKELIFLNTRIKNILNKINKKEFLKNAPQYLIKSEKNNLEKYKKIREKLLEQKNYISLNL